MSDGDAFEDVFVCVGVGLVDLTDRPRERRQIVVSFEPEEATTEPTFDIPIYEDEAVRFVPGRSYTIRIAEAYGQEDDAE